MSSVLPLLFYDDSEADLEEAPANALDTAILLDGEVICVYSPEEQWLEERK